MVKSITNPTIGLTAILLLMGSHAIAENSGSEVKDVEMATAECGSLDNAYGPYDYTNPKDVSEKLPVVEQYHFNQNVESLKSGESSADPGSDLDYVLRAFPNHHRALYSMVQLGLKYKNSMVPPGARYSTECYLIRAARFSPKDATVPQIWGLYLSRLGHTEAALKKYEYAVELDPDSAEANYNLGLLYLKLGRTEAALKSAKIAYQLGYPLMGLKHQLQRKGAWPASPE